MTADIWKLAHRTRLRACFLGACLVIAVVPAAAQAQAPEASTTDPGALQDWHVIDRQMIETYDLRSIADAVALVPGFTTVRTYLLRNIPTARGVLESHYANRVLVMIDGVPAWHASTGEGSLDRVGIEQVERIEVLTGPASVIFGTQAYAGVVNIVLRRAAAPGSPSRGPDAVTGQAGRLATAHAGLGAPTRYEAGMGYSEATDRAAWLVAGDLDDTTGSQYAFTDESGTTGTIDEWVRSARFTFSGSFEDASDSTHRLLLNGFRFDESNLGVTPNFAAGAGNDHRSEGLLISYGWSRTMGERLDVEAGVAYDRSRRELSRTFDDNTRSEVDGFRIVGKAAANVHFSDQSRLRLGLDVDRRASVKYTNFDVLTDVELEQNNMRDRSVWETSLFGDYGYSNESLSVGAGVRLIHNQNFGRHAVFAGSFGYRLHDDHSIWVRAGEAYRSPTLFELFFETSTRTVFGNPELEPETSDTIELEYDGRVRGVTLRAELYHATYDQQIVRVRRFPGSLTDTSTIYVNGPAFSANGVEIEARYRFSPPAAASRPSAQAARLTGLQGTEVYLTYAFVRGAGEDEGAGVEAPFPFVPDHTVTLGIARELGSFLVSGLAQYRSSADGPVARIDGQGRLDLDVAYRHRVGDAELLHSVSLGNVTDSDLATAEYVRQNINLLVDGFGRSLSYLLRIRY